MSKNGTQRRAELMQEISTLLDQFPDEMVQQLAEKWRLLARQTGDISSAIGDWMKVEPSASGS